MAPTILQKNFRRILEIARICSTNSFAVHLRRLKWQRQAQQACHSLGHPQRLLVQYMCSTLVATMLLLVPYNITFIATMFLLVLYTITFIATMLLFRHCSIQSYHGLFIRIYLVSSYTLYRSGQNKTAKLNERGKSVFLGAFRLFPKNFFDTRLRLFSGQDLTGRNFLSSNFWTHARTHAPARTHTHTHTHAHITHAGDFYEALNSRFILHIPIDEQVKEPVGAKIRYSGTTNAAMEN